MTKVYKTDLASTNKVCLVPVMISVNSEDYKLCGVECTLRYYDYSSNRTICRLTKSKLNMAERNTDGTLILWRRSEKCLKIYKESVVFENTIKRLLKIVGLFNVVGIREDSLVDEREEILRSPSTKSQSIVTIPKKYSEFS